MWKLLKNAQDKKIPDLNVYWGIKQLVIFERKEGKSANEYLGFGSTGTIEYFKSTNGNHYFGEKNSKGGHGKGIIFTKDGDINIQ